MSCFVMVLRVRSVLPAAGLRGGSLFRAYRARARAGVGTGAVRAPDSAHEPQGALRLCVESGSFRAGTARREAVRADFASLGPILPQSYRMQVLFGNYF